MTENLFGRRLKELREQKGLSQKELADRAGLGQKSISNWEQGIREPLWSNILSLADALGVDCRAFTVAPASAEKAGPGRPPKVKAPAKRMRTPKAK